MIFKFEGETNIKRLATEVPEAPHFDLTREIERIDQRMVDERLSNYMRDLKMDDYVRCAAVARQLGLSVEPMTPEARTALTQRLTEIADRWNPLSIGQHDMIDLVNNVLMLDRRLLSASPKDGIGMPIAITLSTKLRQLKKRVEGGNMTLEESVCARLVFTDDPTHIKTSFDVNSLKLSNTHDVSTFGATLEHRSRIRLANTKAVPPLSLADIAAIQKFLPHYAAPSEALLDALLSIKILLADEIRNDGLGLHIIDPIPATRAARSRSAPPQPKHL